MSAQNRDPIRSVVPVALMQVLSPRSNYLDACQRALMAVREAIVERTEIFVHQLQCDLERGAAALGSMSTILADVTRRSYFSIVVRFTFQCDSSRDGPSPLRHPHQNIIEAFRHRMLELSPKYNIPYWQILSKRTGANCLTPNGL